MASRLRTRAIVLVFATLIAVPTLSGIAGLGRGTAEAEMSQEDAAKKSGLGWFDYFDDHFPLRTAFIHAHALTSMAMHVSPSPTVIRGLDGWLYDADDSALDDYISATPMSQSELDDWRDAVVHTRDTLRARGIAYVFAIAPDKHVIYPEHMPSSIRRLHQGVPARTADRLSAEDHRRRRRRFARAAARRQTARAGLLPDRHTLE